METLRILRCSENKLGKSLLCLHFFGFCCNTCLKLVVTISEVVQLRGIGEGQGWGEEESGGDNEGGGGWVRGGVI